jgi:PKD repeat protein
MKKSILLLAIVVLALHGKIMASAVSQQQAQNIALNYFKLQVPSAANNSSLAMSLLFSQNENDGTTDFYVFNASPMKGFVIVSGDNNAIPVIAWSSEGNFVLGDLSKSGISDWIKSSATKIHYVVTNNIQADANIQSLWSNYAQGINPQSSRSGGTIGPLCTTIWNQEPYYNSLCPPAGLPSSSLSKAVTGCVATAMAQIMKYWNYPAQGTGGVVTYNDFGWGQSPNYGNLSANMNRPLYWANMGNNATSDTDPIDSLMYELGVAVNMTYDSTGSGAFVLTGESGGGPCSQTVFADNFYYNPNTLQGVYLSSYTTDAWIALLENEINSGRVVQYEGEDPNAGGHTWVMDGYQPNTSGDMLHMNWGWGGAEDGFYSVTNLATPGFNPSQDDAALIGIEPLLPYSLTLSPSNPSVCPNSNTSLSIQGPASATYTWTPPAGLSCTNCTTPIANPTANTLYKVTVDSAGVIGTMSVLVIVTQPVVANFSFNAAASCSLPEAVAFVNNSANASSYVWNFGDGSTSTSTAPQHSYTTTGNYTVSLYATNNCGIDSLVQNQAVQISGGPPPATSVNICSGQTANVTASGSNLLWFSDAAGTNQIQTGNLYITPTLTTTTTYYVGDVISPSPVYAGPATEAIGSASENTSNASTVRGMTFDCTIAQTLNSVYVYATGAGGRTIVLQDASGNILDSMTVYLPYSGGQTVQLGFSIPAGAGMLLGILGTTNLNINTTGAVFPYISLDGTVTITGNNSGQAGEYYFFYNWQIQQNPCTTTLTPVTAFVLNSGGYYFSATGTGTPTVSFAPADTGAAYTYSWNFGDGSAVSDQVNPVHTYAAAGTYTVELIVSNGSCTDTAYQTFNTNLLAGINDIQTFSSLAVYPNPAKDMVTLSVNCIKSFSGCQLSINNILGQNVYAKDIDLASGANKMDINVSNLSEGVYIISLQNGKDIVTSKFIKE